MGTWQIGSGLLKSTWTSYFDDFLSLTPGCIDKHTGLCISTFLHLFGCRLSEYKLALYDQCCKVLGVELALCKSPTGAFEVRNTESRRLELIASLESVLEKGFLQPDMRGERVRGRLQSASNQLFRRRFRHCLRDLNSHFSRGFKNCVAWSWRHPSGSWSGCCKPIFFGLRTWIFKVWCMCTWVGSVKLWCQGWSQTDQARRRRDSHIRAGRFSVCHGIESFRNLDQREESGCLHKQPKCAVQCKSNNDDMNLIIRPVCPMEEQLGLNFLDRACAIPAKPCWWAL